MSIDLNQLAKRWQLTRCPDGDALAIGGGLRLVRWNGRRLAVYGPDGDLIRRMEYGRQRNIEFISRNAGGTLSFDPGELGSILAEAEQYCGS